MAGALRRALAEGRLTDTEPSLVFHDLGCLRDRFEALTESFPPGARHAVAIKANPLLEVLRFLVGLGAGLEAASFEEVGLALAAGCPPERVVFDSPAKSLADLEQALGLGVHLNADNLDELERIASLLRRHETRSTIGLRLNPLVGEGRIASTSVTGATSKFGTPLVEDDPSLIEAFLRYPWLTGVHVHVGSQGCSLEMLVEAVRRAHAFVRRLNQRIGRSQVEILDIGGGLPVAYRETDRPPSVHTYAEALKHAVPEIFSPPFRLITEFGRHLQANCGWAVSRVEYVKRPEGHQIAVLHLGADFLLRRAYNPQDWHHDFLVCDAAGRLKAETDLAPWTIAGPLCFSGDILGKDVPLPPIEPGDLVIIRDVGAYTMGMWSRHCSRGMPTVLGYDAARGGDFQLLRARETAADMVAFWSPTRR